MFVPLVVLENEKAIYNVEQMFTMLDKYVASKSPDLTIGNVGFVKSQCFGVLKSFYDAKKLHGFKPNEIEIIVVLFIMDRYWVSRERVEAAEVVHSLNPHVWLRLYLTR